MAIRKNVKAKNERNYLAYLETLDNPGFDGRVLVNDYRRTTVHTCKFSDDLFNHRCTVKKYLERMESYANNQWWLSDDPAVIAYYQFHEYKDNGIYLVPFDYYELAIKLILDRDFELYELVQPEFEEIIDSSFAGILTQEKLDSYNEKLPQFVERYEGKVSYLGK